MKRYTINKELIKAIKSNKNSLRKLNKELGFEIRNLSYKNKSISETHMRQLELVLNKKFKLKEIYINYGSNFKKKVFTQTIKRIKHSKNLAEFIGIMLGDGNIWRNRVRIAFDKRNEDYIKYVAKLFENLFGIKLKKEIVENTNQAYLHCTNLFGVEELLNFGLLRGNKIKNNLGIPEWIKQNKNYSKTCVRGLIDTDGCIYKCKREKHIYIKFTNFNQQLLKDFKELTSKLGYSFARANKNNWCLYRKDEVVRFIKDIKPLKFNGAVV